MKHDPSGIQMDKQTWKERLGREANLSSRENDREPAEAGGEIVRGGVYPLIDEAIALSSARLMTVEELQLRHNRQEQPTQIGYAPLAIRAEDLFVIEESLNLNFSSGSEITDFRPEYLALSPASLTEIAGAKDVRDIAIALPPSLTTTPAKRRHYSKIGISALVAACVAIGAAIYTTLNPSILAPLTAKVGGVAVTTSSVLGKSIQSPNLAANEFTSLDLSAIGTIPKPSTSTNGATSDRPDDSIEIAPTGAAAGARLSDSLVRSLLPRNFGSNPSASQQSAIGDRRLRANN